MGSHDGGRTPRQVFGGMVRFYRDKAGQTRDETARRIHKSVSLVRAIELGDRAATEDVTKDLEAALGTGGALSQLREEIGDGLGYKAYPSWFYEWLLVEREARRLRSFEPQLVPGLLQRADYARAVFHTRFGMTEEWVEEQVAARLKRQEILDREQPPLLWVILDESVLHRCVGGAHVMREQIRHLIGIAQRSRVSMQVIPSAVAHLGLCAGGFALAECDDGTVVGYQDTASTGQFVDHTNDLAALAECWDTLVREALPWAASLAVLEEAAKSWTSAT